MSTKETLDYLDSSVPCLQVRGHHVAKLDPLGISCVNFDDTPVTVGFHHVGEKRLCGVVSVLSDLDQSINFAFLFPFSPCSSSYPFCLFWLLLFRFLSDYCLLSVSLYFLLLLLFVSVSPENLNYYRYVGIMLPRWTPWELWMLILICASPWILSHLPISSVRLCLGWVWRESFGGFMSLCPISLHIHPHCARFCWLCFKLAWHVAQHDLMFSMSRASSVQGP